MLEVVFKDFKKIETLCNVKIVRKENADKKTQYAKINVRMIHRSKIQNTQSKLE